MKTTFVLGVAVALLASLSAKAAVTDDFESYTAGANIHGQGGWKGWDNSPGAGATVSTTYAASGTKSVNIGPASDLVREFSGVNSGLWTLSLKQYVPSTSSGISYFIAMNKYKDAGVAADYNWSIQTTFDLGTGKVSSDYVAGSSVNLLKNQWVDLRFDINLTAGTVSEYYNNTLIGTHPWQDGTGVNALAAIDLYGNNAGSVFYDDLSLVQVPEPTTAALLGMGALALLFRRKRN